MQKIILLKAATIMAASIFIASPVLAQSADWTGGYVGTEVGSVNYQIQDATNNTLVGGQLTGYDYDMGSLVVGAGVDVDFTGAYRF